MNELIRVASQFEINGAAIDVTSVGSGLINNTYKVTTDSSVRAHYLMQKINHNVFKDVTLLQSNIKAVTDHIRTKLRQLDAEDIDRKVLTIVETNGGEPYYFDGVSYWRVFYFIEDAKTSEIVDPQYSFYAGMAFGRFQSMLADLSAELGETIPNFHNMEFRLNQLRDAVKADSVDRVASVGYYLDEIEKRAQYMCQAEELYRQGRLPKRICHCDTKVNNMLFDNNGNVLCVIDLDTVMPSYVFSDFGDFLRTAANMGSEDDRNLDNVNFDLEIFEAFSRGYLSTAKDFLLPIEIENLPYAAKLFPYMQCVRFLTDYINGDTYYKIGYEDHNLVRTQAQFKLLQSVESNDNRMREIINALSTD